MKTQQQNETNSFEQQIMALSSQFRHIQAPYALQSAIINAIAGKKRKRAFARIAVYNSMAVLSLVFCAIAWIKNSPASMSSETVKLLSLLFSDWEIVVNYWQDYLFSVLESIPILTLMSLLALLWITVISLKKMIAAIISLNQTARHRA